jgi:hypothetical protein
MEDEWRPKIPGPCYQEEYNEDVYRYPNSVELWIFFHQNFSLFNLHSVSHCLSLQQIPLTFFTQIMISDDAAKLLLATKWVLVVVTAYGLGKFFESLIGVELMLRLRTMYLN